MYFLRRRRRVAGCTDELLDTSSMYLACIRSSQRISTRFTSDLETSSRAAVMASEKSEGRRTVESASSCDEFQFPRLIRWPSGERTSWVSLGRSSCSRSVVFWYFSSSSFADGATLVEQRMGAKAENMVIGVILPCVQGGAQRACMEVGPGCCGGGFLLEKL